MHNEARFFVLLISYHTELYTFGYSLLLSTLRRLLVASLYVGMLAPFAVAAPRLLAISRSSHHTRLCSYFLLLRVVIFYYKILVH